MGWGNRALYCNLSRDFLAGIDVNFSCCNYIDQCSEQSHKAMIDTLYNSIVCSLKNAEVLSIPRIPCNALKPFWNAELNDLKQRSIFWHSI